MQNFHTLVTKAKPSFGRNKFALNETRSMFYTHIYEEPSFLLADEDAETFDIMNDSNDASKHHSD